MADALAHQEELLKDPEVHPSFAQLVEVTQVTGVELSASVFAHIGTNESTFTESPSSHTSERQLAVWISPNVRSI